MARRKRRHSDHRVSVFVVETDTADGHGEGVDGAASLAKLEKEHGPLPATLEAESPSGSVHRYFKHPSFPIKNSGSQVGPHIDVRGDGGFVVAPPSVKPGKGAYRWRNDLPIADAPQWLLDRIVAGKDKPERELSISQQALAKVQPPAEADHFTSYGRPSGNGGAYIEAMLSGAYDDVVSEPKGSRNAQLNNSATWLGHFVGGGVLDEQRAIDTLLNACNAAGLLSDDGRRQCLATIRSGLHKGKTEPRGIPERQSPNSPVPDNDNVAANIAGKPSHALPLTYFNDVDKFPPKNWLIKDVLARKESSRIVAAPGMAKSAVAIDLTVHVAAGLDWRGYKSKDKCGVVYFALERADLVRRRLAGHRLRDGLDNLPIAVAGHIINLMHAGCVDIIVETIREAEKVFGCSVGLIVFDVYPKGVAAGGGDENQAKDQGIAITNLARVKELTGVHIMNVAHTGKDESRSTRGSNSSNRRR